MVNATETLGTIISLEIENVMGIRLFKLRPDGAAIVIGGDNEAGKSSVLQSICMLMGGAKLCPPEPLRRGKDKGKVQADLGDVIATRTWERRPDGSVKTELELKSKDGYNAPTPQTILNDMGVLFDPLEFSRMEPQKQLAELQKLVGLDFTDLDTKRASVYQTRTGVNKEGTDKAARLKALTRYEDAPEAELSAADLLAEMDKRQATNKANERERSKVEQASKLSMDAELAKVKIEDEIADLEKRLAERRAALATATGDVTVAKQNLADAEAAAAKLVDADVAEIRAKLDSAEETNRKVRANRDYAKLTEEVNALRKRSKELTAELKALDYKREQDLAAAKFPVPGLGFTADGITYNGLPFEQASTAVQLRTSVAMGFAGHPNGRVLLIKRDGASISKANLKTIAELAEAAGGQVWIEKFVEKDGDRSGCTVVLEDGEIAEVQEPASV